MTVIDIFKKHESRIRKPTEIITQSGRCYKCNINGTDTVGNELQFKHVISIAQQPCNYVKFLQMSFQYIPKVENINHFECRSTLLSMKK